MTFKVAIAGATGAVGHEFLRLLAERDFPISELRLLASARSVGKKLKYRDQEIAVQLLDENAFEGIDIALFSAGGGVSKEFAPHAVSTGALVIDNSSAFRYDDAVPLIVPEINPEAMRDHAGIIANPNCTTIITLMALAPLHAEAECTRVVTSSYQSISGGGASAMAELEQQARDWAADKPLTIETQPHQILFNLYPHIDAFQDNGYTKEEMKLVWEGRKILNAPALRAASTCVRVPVLRSHSVAVNCEFANPLSVEHARELLRAAPGVIVEDDPAKNLYPMPLPHTGKDEVSVGRIREDLSSDGLCFWVVGDQISKGAALNAVQIAEKAIELGLIK